MCAYEAKNVKFALLIMFVALSVFMDGWAADPECLARQRGFKGNILAKTQVLYAYSTQEFYDTIINSTVNKTRKLTFLSVLAKQFGVVPSMADRWHFHTPVLIEWQHLILALNAWAARA